MKKEELHGIYRNALDKFGINAQTMMVFEEIGELMNALAKFGRGRAKVDDVITELADVSIMVEQMAVHYGYEEFEKEREWKIRRLKNKLKKYGDNCK